MARILVIDDDRSLLKMMQMMMERGGYEAILATNGREGIQAAIDEKPDLVIVDVMMPELSGYDVCRQLRENPSTANIPLLILTARSQPMDRQMAADAGADDYVTKPVTRDDLIERVTQLLGSGATNAPSPMVDPVAEISQITDVFAPQEPEAAAELETESSPHLEGELPVVAVKPLHGGAGGTTVAVNLAFALNQYGRSCLIDLGELPGHVAVQLQMMPPAATWQALVDAGPLPDPRVVGSSLMMYSSSRVAVMASPTQHVDQRPTAQTLNHVFGILSEGFKRIIVDLPARVDATSEAVLRMASHVVLVVSDDLANLQSAGYSLRAVDELGLSGQPHIVLNRTRPGGVSLEEAQQSLSRAIDFDLPYEADQTAAIAEGKPLVVTRPESAYSQGIQQIVRTL